MNLLSKPSFNLLEQSLNAATLRQRVIANNIANVDTPNFKRSEVRFEELLKQKLDDLPPLVGYRTDPRHFHIFGRNGMTGQPQIVKDESTAMNNNQNNVDIDYEMALLAKNELRYNTMIQQVNNDLKKLRVVIEGR